jgi:hypothetical protein
MKMKRKRTIRKKKKREGLEVFEKKKRNEISYEETLLQILRQKQKMDDTTVDEDK